VKIKSRGLPGISVGGSSIGSSQDTRHWLIEYRCNVSAYRLAIVQTITTIDTRARYFRNLVVSVVVLTLGSMGWVAVTWTFLPLAGLLLLIPAGGLFFFLDAKLLNDWRSRLLDAWVRKEIELRGFCDAVSAIPTLPKETLQSMLATLPTVDDLPTEQPISTSIREGTVALTTSKWDELPNQRDYATGGRELLSNSGR